MVSRHCFRRVIVHVIMIMSGPHDKPPASIVFFHLVCRVSISCTLRRVSLLCGISCCDVPFATGMEVTMNFAVATRIVVFLRHNSHPHKPAIDCDRTSWLLAFAGHLLDT